VHAAKKGTLLPSEVLDGMLRAFVCFRRPLVFDLASLVERPLTQGL